ncbi:MAG: PASTA domain-containing protein [Armatimonadota bacterium]
MIGETLGLRYEIQAKIVEGPIFTMYSARDRLTGRSVGIREINKPFNDEPAFIQGLLDQIPKLTVGHPALENLQEIFEENGQHYVLSEMPKGSLLRERIKRFAPFTVPVALTTAQAVAEALDALHQSGIAHGDVGPHNVVATHDGSAKLELAGIWQCYPLSRTAGAAVLPQMANYLAPEVCTGAKPNPLSDLYSLGIILYELLIGSVPFQGENPTATTMRHISSPVPSLRGINAAIPVAVEQLVNRLLAKKPEQRIQSAHELVVELRQINDQIRFGRTPVAKKAPVPVQAPIVEAAAPTKPQKKPAKVRQEPTPDKDGEERAKRVKKDRDVPGWLMALLALAILGAAGVVIAFVVDLAQKPREIKTPNIRGVSVAEAREQVRKLKLSVRVSAKEPNERLEPDHIISTRPAPGQMIREGGTIDLVVSSGSRRVKMPSLLNMTADEAKIALGAMNLELEGKPARITIRKNEAVPGAIIKQLPEAGTDVSRFSKVRIWIAAYSDNPLGSLPGESDSDGGAMARSFKFSHTVKNGGEEVRVNIEMTDEAGTTEVHNDFYTNGDKIDVNKIGYGPKATFKVYYDGVLQETVDVEPKLTGAAPKP